MSMGATTPIKTPDLTPTIRKVALIWAMLAVASYVLYYFPDSNKVTDGKNASSQKTSPMPQTGIADSPVHRSSVSGERTTASVPPVSNAPASLSPKERAEADAAARKQWAEDRAQLEKQLDENPSLRSLIYGPQPSQPPKPKNDTDSSVRTRKGKSLIPPPQFTK